jgi:hypothetical protein
MYTTSSLFIVHLDVIDEADYLDAIVESYQRFHPILPVALLDSIQLRPFFPGIYHPWP